MSLTLLGSGSLAFAQSSESYLLEKFNTVPAKKDALIMVKFPKDIKTLVADAEMGLDLIDTTGARNILFIKLTKPVEFYIMFDDGDYSHFRFVPANVNTQVIEFKLKEEKQVSSVPEEFEVSDINEWKRDVVLIKKILAGERVSGYLIKEGDDYRYILPPQLKEKISAKVLEVYLSVKKNAYVVLLTNTTGDSLNLKETDFYVANTRAISIVKPTLAPGESTLMIIVARSELADKVSPNRNIVREEEKIGR